jgi:hypothetical protein
MNDLKYHLVEPQNTKDSYGENETIDFKTSANNRKLIGGTVRLLGNVSVSNNNLLNTNVFYDAFTGSHSFIDNIKTTFSNTGQVENVDNYSRYVASKARASLTKNDLFNSMYVCENRVPDNVMAKKLLKGVVMGNEQDAENLNDAHLVAPLDFALQLDFCLNNMIGDTLLPFNKTGDVLISIQTAAVVNALWGNQDVGIDTNYQLSNLRLVYQSVQDDGKYGKYTMRVKSSIKQSIQSTNATVSTKVPVVADSFFMTFINQSHEGDKTYNSLACEKVPLFQRLEVAYNDNISQQYTYQIDNEEEVITNFIKAVQKVSSDNNASFSTLASNDSYGVGFNFNAFVDLSKTKLSVNLKSSINNNNPMLAYMFFNGLVTI